MAAPAPSGPRIFVSHAHQDDEFCLRLIADLRARLGEEAVWYDTSGGLHGSDQWWDRIVAEITDRPYFLVVLSPNANSSKWVPEEMAIAWRQKVELGKRLLPVRLADSTRREDWKGVQEFNFTGHADPARYAAALNELVGVLGVSPGQRMPQASAASAAPAVDRPLSVVERWAREANSAYGRQVWSDVMDKTDLLIERDAMTADLWRKRASAAEALRDSRAGDAITKALASDPDDVDTLMLQGRIYTQEAKHAQAATSYQRAYQVSSIDDAATRLTILEPLCAALAGAQRWDDLARRAGDARRMAPDDPRWLRAERDALTGQKRQSEALALARQIAAPPDASADDLLALARLARETGALTEAGAALGNATRRAPDRGALAGERTALLAALAAQREREVAAGNWDQALSLLEQELPQSPGNSDAQQALLIIKAQLLTRIGRENEARQLVINLVSAGANPVRDPKRALSLAQLCADLGLAAYGWSALETAGLLEPAALRGEDGERAATTASALYGRTGASAGQRVTLARTLAAAGRLKQAWPALAAQAVADDPQVASLRAQLFPPPVIPARLASLGYRGGNIGEGQAIMPPVITIPAGRFLMGSDPAKDSQANDREYPQHWVEVAAFQIAKYPVTVAEYALAVAAKAVREPLASGSVNWAGQQQHPDHPVVCVSWQDAVAYCAWLAQATGWRWRLPTEAEWEKAARWDAQRNTSRIYPWGDSYDQNRCNTSESGIRTTSPVGGYSASDPRRSGASPYGVEEMAGNVWEWASSVYKPYPYTQNDGREDPESTENRTLRGGSWYNDASNARAAYRDYGRWDILNYDVGFRLALSPGAGSS